MNVWGIVLLLRDCNEFQVQMTSLLCAFFYRTFPLAPFQTLPRLGVLVLFVLAADF